MKFKRQELINHIIDNIEYYEGTQADELHHELFNTDYYLIGYYDCERWLIDGELNNTFEVINYIKEYEQNNFGEVTTDLSSSESVVNMYAFIMGEEILGDIESYNIEGLLTKKDIELIKWKLKNIDIYMEFSMNYNKMIFNNMKKIKKVVDNAIHQIKYNMLDDGLKPIIFND